MMLERTKAAAMWLFEPYKELIEGAPWWLILFNFLWMTLLTGLLVASHFTP